MLPLHPNNQFTVVRQIANHLDTDTNYVRAVIRNAYTDAIITTLDLIDRTGQRFSKNWRIPADPSGQGFYISIVTSVYTDSGYTTKNANYGDEENTYIIQDRVVSRGGSGGGIDSRTLRRVVGEILDEKLTATKEKENSNKVAEKKATKKIEKSEELALIPEVLAEINKLKEIIAKQTEPEKLNYKPFYEGLQSVIRAVNEKEVTEATDISPILKKIQQVIESHSVLNEDIREVLSGLYAEIGEKFPPIIAEQLKSTTFKIAPSTAVVDAPVEKKEPKEEEKLVPFDINSLTS